jgi:hypothetical protein
MEQIPLLKTFPVSRAFLYLRDAATVWAELTNSHDRLV